MTSPAAHAYRRRIRFSETDAGGVAHFSRLAALVEEAEHDWFRGLGIPVFGPRIVWPRVRFEIQYHAACRFGDEVLLRLWPDAIQAKSVVLAFAAEILDPPRHPTPAFSGKMVVCHARIQKNGGFLPAPLPARFRKLLQQPAPISS